MYGEGISREGDLLDCAVDEKVIEKSGSWFSFEGNRIGQGRENVKTFLKDNPEITTRVESILKDRFHNSPGASTTPEEAPPSYLVDEDGVILD